MRLILTLLILWTSAFAQSSDWAKMSQGQKDFAYKCIEWGREHKDVFYYIIKGDTLDMGETLAALPWNESSLNADTKHKGGHSKGPWGLKKSTVANIRASKTYPKRPRVSGFEELGLQADIWDAAAIYLDCIRYIKQWHHNRGLAITNRRAWQLAAQVYRDGTNWQRRKEYGRVFRQRVAFLTKIKEK